MVFGTNGGISIYIKYILKRFIRAKESTHYSMMQNTRSRKKGYNYKSVRENKHKLQTGFYPSWLPHCSAAEPEIRRFPWEQT
jgi:hypothetical protein